MSEDKKTAEQMAAEIKAAQERAVDGVRALAEEALGKAKSGETLTLSLEEKADEALLAMNQLREQVSTLEQKAARAGDGRHEPDKTMGEKFVETDELKALVANPRPGASAQMRLKADITTATTGAGGVGGMIVPNRSPALVEMPRRAMTIRQLLMPGRTDSPIVEYDKETGFTNNADVVAEGALKPQSDITITPMSTRTKVIAHWFRVTKQTLSDVRQISTLIDTRLRYGIQDREEIQLLFGDGTGENLLGIVPQATAYANPLGSGDTQSIDKLRLMMLQASLALFPASGVVMHDSDWAWIELLKDTTGRYIIGDPQGVAGKRLWGIPVVTTPIMTLDKVLVGAFDMGAQIWDQWETTIEVGFQNDDFTKNKVTILGEERLALAVYRPESFIYGDFGRQP